MKLGIIVSPVFISALVKLTGAQLPLTDAFKRKSIALIVEGKNKSYNEARLARAEALAEKDEQGKAKILENGNFDVTPENISILAGELNALLDEEVEMPKIKLESLMSNNDIVFTAQELVFIEEILEE